MNLIDQLAEQHIARAIEQGELDNLPGRGQPLELDDDSHVPAELRAGYRLLKNANYLPPELQLRREIQDVECLIRHLQPGPERDRAGLRLALLKDRLVATGRSRDWLAEEMAYHRQLRQRMGRRREQS